MDNATIKRIELKVTQVQGFIDEDLDQLKTTLSKFSVRLSLDSWRAHQEELSSELNQIPGSTPRG